MQAHSEDHTGLEEIEKYAEGKLAGEEKARFEAQLQEDGSLAEEKAAYHTLVSGIKAVERQKMLRSLQETDAMMPDVEQEDKKPLWTINRLHIRREVYYWAAAAMVLMILVPTYYFVQQGQHSEQLFSQYFSPHTETLIPISAEARKNYQQGNYSLAVRILEEAETYLMNDGKKQDTAELANQFYQGNAYLALNQPKEAISCFLFTLEDHSGLYREESEWYLGLSYLKVKKVNEARRMLEKIAAQPPHAHYEEAVRLLKNL
jgi:tetratricopeptide (TPR) repeat protein